MDTSKSFAPWGAIDETEQARLPRGSALLLETILMLARQIHTAPPLDVLQAHEWDALRMNAGSIEDMAGELIAKYNRQIGLAA